MQCEIEVLVLGVLIGVQEHFQGFLENSGKFGVTVILLRVQESSENEEKEYRFPGHY